MFFTGSSCRQDVGVEFKSRYLCSFLGHCKLPKQTPLFCCPCFMLSAVLVNKPALSAHTFKSRESYQLFVSIVALSVRCSLLQGTLLLCLMLELHR